MVRSTYSADYCRHSVFSFAILVVFFFQSRMNVLFIIVAVLWCRIILRSILMLYFVIVSIV